MYKNNFGKRSKAVFLSWNTERAIVYRKINHIHDLKGTAVNICTMVFGNMGEDSGTGVAFTRNPSTGEKELFGEFLPNAQGEDIVAGTRTPYKIAELKKRSPQLYKQFEETCKILETHYKDMQDIEFTIEQNKLFLLQTRSAKRTGNAALKVAVEMYEEGLITKEEALLLVPADQMTHSLLPIMDPEFKDYNVLTRGVIASFGMAIGKIIFDAKKLEKLDDGESYILMCQETSPEYLMAMYKAKGVVTARGGATSHAAVVTRAMGKPCVVGCHEIIIDEEKGICSIGDTVLKEGDTISLNATLGELIEGSVPLVQPKLDSKEVKMVIGWANEVRRLKIRVNADTPAECKKALELGAQGVGLTRTEHMFFDKERILYMREMIFAHNVLERTRALNKILPFQQKDFLEIFEQMQGLPVTIRLLDPPLNEFLPKELPEQQELAKHMNITLEDIHVKQILLSEENPMLGLRGCRLGIVYPEITEMQIEAIINAGCDYQKNHKKDPQIDIMIPLVGTIGEVQLVKGIIKETAAKVFEKRGQKFDYKIGTMIEIPRAAIIADQIAEEMQFFSFGTNDLTQLTYGYSRDDSHTFIELYHELKILPYNPFAQIDEEGVGYLVKLAVKNGKAKNPTLKLGVCGEHGGNPKSIYFFHKVGIEYVSCSTFRVPTAILAAAQAAILEKMETK
jgi:pyruvate,orthophosphate dikinase